MNFHRSSAAELTDEARLIERAKKDAEAFGELYDRYYSPIVQYIWRRVGDGIVAQDLTSEVFFKALRRIGKFAWQGVPFSAWLYRIAANEIADYFRNPKRQLVSLDELYEEYEFEPVATTNLEAERIEAERIMEAHREFLLVRGLLQEMPLPYQEVIALRYFEHKQLSEISQITGKPLGTVKSLLSRGLDRLRDQYEARMQPNQSPGVMRIEEGEI